MLQQVRSGSVLILHMPERGALTKKGDIKMARGREKMPRNSIEKCPHFLFRQLDCWVFFGSQVDGNLAVARAGTSRWQMNFQRGGEFARLLGALFLTRYFYPLRERVHIPLWEKEDTWNAKCAIFLGNFTPKTSNYCLKNRALGFPGTRKSWTKKCWLVGVEKGFSPRIDL